IDGAEAEVAALCAPARALDVVEQPGRLGCGEVGIEEQPGALSDGGLVTRLPERGAGLGRSPVLPDDGAVDRRAGPSVPDNHRLPLVGDPDRGDVGGGDAGLLDGRATGRHYRPPDLVG